ncbi:hypothetical protein F2Q70_00029478 [Brassica cretica]|uniref:Uncharacterized protein n=2 Tax=Brassica cretica TaxID=69181 RepID=A0A3N6SE23_BRACR|nr:hypothetical protein F2Q70_00029478 [Brassica cretica]KAF2551213.1 hypothetical protein F2Q68_00033845 [Brassica cretica]KAF3592458.1 hypothetical protein DY000_02021171 [Brassica cretica]
MKRNQLQIITTKLSRTITIHHPLPDCSSNRKKPGGGHGCLGSLTWDTPPKSESDGQTSVLNRESHTRDSHHIEGKINTPNTTKDNADNRIRKRDRIITKGAGDIARFSPGIRR